MSLSLPQAISTYFAIGNGADIASVKRCFTLNAVVFDEGKTHRGTRQSKRGNARRVMRSTIAFTPLKFSRKAIG